MSVRILIGDVRTRLKDLPHDSIDCVVTSPPYWGLRDYGVDGQLGMEPTLGEHIATMVDVMREVRRVMKPTATLWLNYGDCYATKPNGRSAEATKAAGNDDRTFRDKPFSTVGPVHGHLDREYEKTPRAGKTQNFGNLAAQSGPRVVGVGMLKPKDLCMVPNRLAIALQDDGWWVRSEIIWGKPNPMPDSSGRYRPSTAHEKIWLLTKSGKSFYDSEAVWMPLEESSLGRLSQDVDTHGGSDRANGGRKTNGRMKAVGGPRKSASTPRSDGDRWNENDGRGFVPTQDGRLLRNYEPAPWEHIGFLGEVWSIPPAAFKDAHFATFPPALVEPCIAAGCPKGGTVLDPFGGAGTTGMVADRMERDAILIELNPEYAELARRRIHNDAGMFAQVAAE